MDGKYFSTSKRGEISELKEELNQKDKAKKKETVKKVIAAMTLGKDVSGLFTDVLNCMQTPDVELKKLVYLYVLNYAKTQPDLAILAVNTFVNDAQDPNPLIRALAIRTMGCIRVDKITEYLCDPLARCLKDSDPYVRKTAAVCVAKLYDINPELVTDKGFLETLKDLLSDANPMVVANTVAALSEIAETSGRNDILPISTSNLQKLQAALNECTEWGQVFILDALANYQPGNSREAESLVERVLPRLNHANSAVVLSAVKLCMKFLDLIENEDFVRTLLRKLGPSLVTLLSREPEVQYVALRNINLIVQKRPLILAHEIKVFYCKYNDPVYVKLEKLEIMIRLASERNIDQVLLEFKEYATEVDVDFVRKSVRAIGRCAVKLEKAAERCISVLLDLIQTKVNYVVQEAIVVIKDIFRRYPDRYESIIATLCESLERLDEPEAKASMIWIIGEYAGRIDNADQLLDTFLDSFVDEPAEVQLQLLTATVKLFLRKPTDTQEMVQKVLTMATQSVDNPDLRDRGYLYWRLLSTDPEAAKRVVLADKPVITDDTNSLDTGNLDALISQMSTLASVYHKPPETFVSKIRTVVRPEDDNEIDEPGGHMHDDEDAIPAEAEGAVAPVVDLLDLDRGGGGGGALDIGELFSAPAAPAARVNKTVLVNAEKGRGVVVEGAFVRRAGALSLDLTFRNTTQGPVGNLAIQFNKNSFGILPNDRLNVAGLNPMASADTVLPCTSSAAHGRPGPLTSGVQIAVNTSLGVIYFEAQAHLHIFFSEDGKLPQQAYLQQWKEFGDATERAVTISNVSHDSSADTMVRALEARNVFFVAKREKDGNVFLYHSAKVTLPATNISQTLLFEFSFVPGSHNVKVSLRFQNPDYIGLLEAAIRDILVDSSAPAAAPAANNFFGAPAAPMSGGGGGGLGPQIGSLI